MCIRDRYREIGEAFAGLDSWSEYLITSYEDTERCIGKKADKKRKIYNGMLRTNLYQYIGPKPPKKKRPEAQKIIAFLRVKKGMNTA